MSMLYIDETVAEIMGAEASTSIFPNNPFTSYPDLRDAWFRGYMVAALFAVGDKVLQ